MDEKRFGKVLIISAFGMDSDLATDITLRSYFTQWPKEKILILTTSFVKNEFAETIIIGDDVFSKLRTRLISLFGRNGLIQKSVLPSSSLGITKNRIDIKQNLFGIGSSYRDLFDLRLNRQSLKRVDDFKPEIIYTILGNRRLVRLVYNISVRFDINIVPHFMDDWISTIYRGNYLLAIPRSLFFHSFSKMMGRAQYGLGISQKMCNVYSKKFDKKFIPLMNTIDFTLFSSMKKIKENRLRTYVFMYFGGLHLNRWKTLRAFSLVLDEVSTSIQADLQLIIYTKNADVVTYSPKFKTKNVAIYPAIIHKEACLEMKKANFLLHVESFDKDVIQYTKLSISTKIPEYLASETQICAIGPRNIASMEYLRDNNCGFIANSLVISDLKNMISEAIENYSNNDYVKRNLALAANNHSIGQLNMFRDLLAKSSDDED